MVLTTAGFYAICIPAQTCNFYACPAGTVPHAFVANTVCASDPCTNNDRSTCCSNVAVQFSVWLSNLNYDVLEASPSLLGVVFDVVKNAIAGAVGTDDIALAFEAGSVIVKVKLVPDPTVTSADFLASFSTSDVHDDITFGLNKIAGIDGMSTGLVFVSYVSSPLLAQSSDISVAACSNFQCPAGASPKVNWLSIFCSNAPCTIPECCVLAALTTTQTSTITNSVTVSQSIALATMTASTVESGFSYTRTTSTTVSAVADPSGTTAMATLPGSAATVTRTLVVTSTTSSGTTVAAKWGGEAVDSTGESVFTAAFVTAGSMAVLASVGMLSVWWTGKKARKRASYLFEVHDVEAEAEKKQMAYVRADCLQAELARFRWKSDTGREKMGLVLCRRATLGWLAQVFREWHVQVVSCRPRVCLDDLCEQRDRLSTLESQALHLRTKLRDAGSRLLVRIGGSPDASQSARLALKAWMAALPILAAERLSDHLLKSLDEQRLSEDLLKKKISELEEQLTRALIAVSARVSGPSPDSESSGSSSPGMSPRAVSHLDQDLAATQRSEAEEDCVQEASGQRETPIGCSRCTALESVDSTHALLVVKSPQLLRLCAGPLTGMRVEADSLSNGSAAEHDAVSEAACADLGCGSGEQHGDRTEKAVERADNVGTEASENVRGSATCDDRANVGRSTTGRADFDDHEIHREGMTSGFEHCRPLIAAEVRRVTGALTQLSRSPGRCSPSQSPRATGPAGLARFVPPFRPSEAAYRQVSASLSPARKRPSSASPKLRSNGVASDVLVPVGWMRRGSRSPPPRAEEPEEPEEPGHHVGRLAGDREEEVGAVRHGSPLRGGRREP